MQRFLQEILKDVDKDYDRLYDFEETIQNTDPDNPDTDGNGLSVLNSMFQWSSNPEVLDSDEEPDSIDIIRAIIPFIKAQELKNFQNLMAAQDYYLAATNKDVVKGDYVVRVILDSSWTTPPAHNVEQKVLEVFYDKDLYIKGYRFVHYQ